MRKATKRESGVSTVQQQQRTTIRHACRGVVGGLENLEGRQLLTTVIDWRLNEGPSGVDINDSAGGDNAGWLNGNPTWVASRGGTGADAWALALDGDGDEIATGEFSNLIGNTASVSFWIKTTTTGTTDPRTSPAVVGSNNAETMSNDIIWGFIDTTGRIGLHVAGAVPTGGKDTVKSDLPINDGLWHQVTMTRDTTTGDIQIYVDGYLNDSGVANGEAKNFAPVTSFGSIAQRDGGRIYLSAQLDQVRIDDSVITASDVGQMFNPSGQAPSAPTNFAVNYSGARALRLSWTPSANTSYYEVWRRVAGQGAFVKLDTNASGNSFFDTGLTPSTSYEYQLKAVNPSGTSAATATVTGTTTAVAAPGTGTGLLGIYYDEDGGPGTGRGGDNTPFNSVGRLVTRLDPQINFTWGDAAPHPQIDANNFTARWEGQLQAQYSEPYTFFKESDDGFAMQIELTPGNWVTLFEDWDYQGMEGAPGLPSAAVNLVAGQKYNIRAEQFDGDGGAGAILRWASPSTPVEVIPTSQLYLSTAAAPVAPSGLQASAGATNGTVNLTWTDNSNDGIGFVILRSSTGGAGTFREIARVAGRTDYTDRTLPGATYHYQVRAFHAGAESNSSNSASTQPNASLNGLKVDFYRGQFNNPANPVTGNVLDTIVYANPTVDWGNGAPSAAVGVDDFTSVWTGKLNITEAGTYTFYTNTDDGSFIWIDGTLVLNDPTYHGTGIEVIGVPDHSGAAPLQPAPNANHLPPNGQPITLTAGVHDIIIRAFEGGGGAAVNVGWIKPNGTKEIIPAGVFGAQTLAAPAAPAAAPATGVFSEKVTINWADVSGESAFFLERATQANFSDAVQIAQLGQNVTSYTDEEVTPGNRYYYRVRAANQGGHSAWTVTPDATGVLTLTDEPVPTAPTNVKAALRPNLTARITWTDASDNEANFIVQRSTDGTNFTDVATVAANATWYLDTGLTNGTTYTYRVVAVNGQDERSAASNIEDVIASNTTITSPWANTDIGSPGRAGSASFDAEEGQYTVIGGGGDIWGTNDQLHFLHQQVTGDFQVTARVVEFTNDPVTDPWAKAGVMFREELTGGSQHAINAVTASNQVHLQGRLVTGGESYDNGAPGGSQNQTGWVRLVRAGQTITGYWSADGVNWVQNGTRTYEGLNDTLYVGLGNTAHDNNDLNTVVFDNFSLVTGGPSLAPTNLDATAVPGNNIVVTWRDANPIVSGYRLERSIDGGAWQQVGGDLPGTSRTYIDTATTPGSYSYRVTAFNGSGTSPTSTADAATPAAGQTGAPTGWTSADIGAVGLPGSASYLDANKSFQLVGSGADIWGSADEFQYVYQPVTGDATIVARVLDLTNTDPWSKVGLMFREGLTAGSQHVMLAASRDNGVHMQGREVADLASFDLTATGAPARPVWLKLERVGDTFNGYVSDDGMTWSSTPAVTRTVDMDDTIYVGLALTSHDDTETNTAYVEGVTVTTGTPVPQGINLNGTAANDAWYLKRVGDQVHVWNNATGTGTAVSQHALGQALNLNGLDGDDTVTVDMSGGDINLSSLTITGANGTDKVRLTNGDGKVLTLASLPTLNGEYLDLGTADLKLTGVAPAAVETLLASARNGATRWQGPGIGTSSSTADTGLAPVQQGADTLVKYTYNGDANGDGRINADDYFEIDSGFLAPPADPTYADGDFNFDNAINADDYFLIDSAFLGQGAVLGSGTASASAATAAAAPVAATAAPVVTSSSSSSTQRKKAVRKPAPESSLFGSKRIEKRGTVSRRGR